MVKYTGRGLVVKRPGVLSKVQMLTLVLGVGVFSPSSNKSPPKVYLGCFWCTFAGTEAHKVVSGVPKILDRVFGVGGKKLMLKS